VTETAPTDADTAQRQDAEIAPEPAGPEEVVAEIARPARSDRRNPGRLLAIIALAMVAVLGGLCGWLGYQAQQARRDQQLTSLLVQVARQAAVNLTTIDYQQADADVARILGSATGQFYDDFEKRAGPFVEVVKKAQSKSVGTVTEAGVESVTGQEAQVLVAVSVKSTNAGKPEEEPRFWRMRFTVAKTGDEAKVSKVDFVP
jgi:Mce-associated membrane protein